MTEAIATMHGAQGSDAIGAQPGDPQDKPRSLAGDAWRQLRRRPLFWVSASLIAVFLVMAAFPGLFTHVEPRQTFDVRMKPSGEHWFGTDGQGYDIYARTIHGARASILVGVLTTLIVAVVGVFFGVIAAYFGGWIDAVISRISDIFFAIPVLLGGILFMTTFRNTSDTPYLWVVMKVVLAMSILGWPSVSRLVRASVLQVKPSEYVVAARAGRLHVADHLEAHHPQRHGAGDRLQHDQPGCLHRCRGDAVVSRHRSGRARGLLGCGDR